MYGEIGDGFLLFYQHLKIYDSQNVSRCCGEWNAVVGYISTTWCPVLREVGLQFV